MTKDTIGRVLAVVAIVIAIIGLFTPFGQQTTAVVANTVQKTGNILDTDYFDFYQATTGFQLGNVRAGTINTGGGVVSCGTTVKNALVSGSLPAACNVLSSTASSTVIAIGPFPTSTLTQLIVTGMQGATTTDMVVGTSTTPYVNGGTTNAGTTTIAENIMGLATIATSSTFYSIAGTNIGSTKGYNPAAGKPVGGAQYITTSGVGLGLGDYVLLFSTSTYFGATTGGTTTATVGVPSSITVKYEYQF